jgi:hypothetical protein
MPGLFRREDEGRLSEQDEWRSSKVGDVYVRDGVWIDVHLSKVRYQEADRELFLSSLRSIRVSAKTARV